MNKTDQEKNVTPYHLFMIVLNLVAIVVAIATFGFDQIHDDTRSVLVSADMILSVLLLADFGWRFYQVERKDWRSFWLPWGIIDLLGCFPAIPLFRIFRLIRIFRLLHVLREVGLKQIVRKLKQQIAESTLWLMITMTIPLVLVSGWWIFRVENESCNAGVSGAICSFGDGVWWAFVTVTTVGYGDRFPASGSGRLLAGILMTIGVGFFGILTSYLATIFVRNDEDDIEAELKAVRQELAEIKALLKQGDQGEVTGQN